MSTSTSSPEWVSVNEAAETLGMTRDHVRLLLRQGALVGRRTDRVGAIAPVWEIDPQSVQELPPQVPGTKGRPRGSRNKPSEPDELTVG